MTGRAIDTLWDEVCRFDPKNNLVAVSMHMDDMKDIMLSYYNFATIYEGSYAQILPLENADMVTLLFKGREVNHLQVEVSQPFAGIFGSYTVKKTMVLNIIGPHMIDGLMTPGQVPIINIPSQQKGKAKAVQFGNYKSHLIGA